VICPFGRTFNPEHPTCRSHLRQGGTCQQKDRRKVRKAVTSGMAGPGRWMTTLDLMSPNAWANKQNGRRVYSGCKREWKKALSGAEYHLGRAHGMRRVEIVRYVASRGHLMDKDNAYGGCKPLLDCLTALGVLIDDDLTHLDLVVRQEIGTPRVEITVKEITDDQNSRGAS
jgi:hypothetical protein